MKKIAILQSNYIPWKGYFDLISRSDIFVFYDEVQYTKNDWRNRNLIKTPKGVEWLTIPVRRVELTQKISDTQIAFPNWRIKHWNSLKQNYGRSPFFGTYSERLRELYLGTGDSSLSAVNKRFILEICSILGITTHFSNSELLELRGDKNQRLIEAVKKLGGSVYLSGPAAKSYLNEGLFFESGIQVEWMNYEKYREYPQLFPPFQHHVSVLDLLFNVGPAALEYMTPL